MRKICFHKSRLVAILLSVVLLSCLKDKGYEDGEYGAVRNTAGQEFVTIPRASSTVNALGVESRTGMQLVKLFALSYDHENPAPADFTAKLRLNNDLVRAADSTATILPATAYTIPTLDVQFRQGKRISDTFAININTSLLDPSKKYGIGFTLESTTKSGAQIPTNLRNVVYVFSIKNKYDGIYTFKARYDIPADRPAEWLRTPFTYPFEVQLITTGPNSVRFFNTAFSAGFQPLMVPGASGLGATEANFTFDANDKLVGVTNPAADSRNRQFALNPAVTDNRYDPATKTFYSALIFTQNSFLPISMYDTLIYLRARP